MSKFKIGNKVIITGGSLEGKSGIIKEVRDIELHGNDIYERTYVVANEENPMGYHLREGILELDKTQTLFEKVMAGITDEAFYEMAGRISGEAKIPNDLKKPGLIIAVGGNENRGEAHFHIFRNNVDLKEWKNGACLLFKDNRYFDHKPNNKILTKDELEAVVLKLKEKVSNSPVDMTNWQYLITLWNQNNYNFAIDPNTVMPNYNYKTIKIYKNK